MSSTSTSTSTKTSVLRTRAAIKTFRASKDGDKVATPEVPEPVIPEGKYGRYYSPLEEPDEMKKIVRESTSLELGVAAVLLEIALPEVGKGVARHSSFTYKRIERARRTVIYIYAMTFGTPEERRLITDATHRAHSHVKGKDYDANDVDAQLWVAATIYWTMVQSYELTFGKLDDERAERVYREYSVMATALRVPPEKWPQDRAAFQVYWDDMISKLEVSDEARGVAKDLINQKGLPFGFLWLYATLKGPITRVLTTEVLPERIRNDFGLPSTPYTRQMFKLITATNAAIIPYLPVSWREFPKNYYLADMRKRIVEGKGP
jgi:uncharacterized protein (DUF2236 family)